jgi:hypothetical protein
MAVILPLTAPEVKGQVVHLGSAFEEDQTGLPYDIGPVGDGEVIWDPEEDHIISDPIGYLIEPGMTLNIPPLNYLTGGPDEHEITFQGMYKRIEVFGTLITNLDTLMPPTYTAFLGDGFASFDGIYFHSGSQGRIYDTLIRNAVNGVVFEPGSTVMSPGIAYSFIEDVDLRGIKLDGALGDTRIEQVYIDASINPGAICVDIANGSADMFNVFHLSHGPDLPSLRISNASVNVDTCQFNGDNQPGNMVQIEGNSNGTTLDHCLFMKGETGNHYIRINGSSPLISNCKFNEAGGELSVVANEEDGIPSHPVLLNPTGQDGSPGSWDDSFDNSTMNVTGNSSITLKWYMDVHVENPDGGPIYNAFVWVNDTFGDPAEPPTLTTDAGGLAGFIVTELIQYNDSVDNFNPFNVTADAFSMKGYAVPEPLMNMSREIYITVPYDPNNLPPMVSWITTPFGIQSGDITIQYKLEDPNPDDNGSLSVEVYYSIDNINWFLATQGGGDPTTGLDNDTTYTFIWDSGTTDLADRYYTTVYIKIIPFDWEGNGTPSQTGSFIVDNKPPEFLGPPTATPTNNTCLIEWTVDEPADAVVWYGIDDTLTDETWGSTGTTLQSVTLTNLQPGRKYTFVLKSTDIYGNEASSYPTTYEFFTKVYIQLYEGWNMISVPFNIVGNDFDLENILASIEGDWDTVWMYHAWDPWGDPWKLNDTNNPLGSDLNESILIPDHEVPDNDFSVDIPLFRGWNFIGYPGALTRPIDDALAGITYDMIKTYDAATDQWLSYDSSSGTGDLDTMEMGRGYWLYVPESYPEEYQLWALTYA